MTQDSPHRRSAHRGSAHRGSAHRGSPIARSVALSVIVVALVGACAQPGTGRDPGPGPGTYEPDDVVLRMEFIGGFVPAERLVGRIPTLTVYGDGRAITEGPTVAIYPSPALPNVLAQTISPAGVEALVTKALDHGVGRHKDLGQPGVADAPNTRFTVLTNEGPKVTEVYALGINDQGSGLTPAQRSARRELQELQDDLTDLRATLGADAVGDQKPYKPTAVAAISREWTDPGSTDIPAQPEKAWPGPTLPGDVVGTYGLGCVTVTGADVRGVLDAAESANVLTPWVSDGRRWQVTFRPLLPEETSCADLA